MTFILSDIAVLFFWGLVMGRKNYHIVFCPGRKKKKLWSCKCLQKLGNSRALDVWISALSQSIFSIKWSRLVSENQSVFPDFRDCLKSEPKFAGGT